MKKQIYLVLFMIVVISLVGCRTILGASEVVKEKASMDIADTSQLAEYFPFLENNLIEYTGEGNEFAEQKVYFEFIKDNRAQIKVMNSGTNLVKILELKDGTLTEIYIEGEFYHIENMLNVKEEKHDIILKEPLEVGNKWVTTEGYVKEITSLDTVIDTRLKSFEALEVTTTFTEGRTQRDYYSKGTGFVGRIYKDGETEIKTLLSNITTGPLTQEVLVYYPLKEDIKTGFIRDTIDFSTNNSIEKLLEFKMKNPIHEELGVTLQPGVIINSIYLDRSQWTVKADFNDALLTDLNAGSSYEYELLKSIVNTLGKFYDTEKVYISVEGRPYESGHYSVLQGESFTVDTVGVEEFK